MGEFYPPGSGSSRQISMRIRICKWYKWYGLAFSYQSWGGGMLMFVHSPDTTCQSACQYRDIGDSVGPPLSACVDFPPYLHFHSFPFFCLKFHSLYHRIYSLCLLPLLRFIFFSPSFPDSFFRPFLYSLYLHFVPSFCSPTNKLLFTTNKRSV